MTSAISDRVICANCSEISYNFFKISVIHLLLPLSFYFPLPRDTSVLSRLRTARRFTRLIPRSKNVVLLLIML